MRLCILRNISIHFFQRRRWKDQIHIKDLKGCYMNSTGSDSEGLGCEGKCSNFTGVECEGECVPLGEWCTRGTINPWKCGALLQEKVFLWSSAINFLRKWRPVTLTVHKHEIILNFFLPKSNRFFSFDFRQNFDVLTFPRWLSIRETKFFFRDIQKIYFQNLHFGPIR